MSNSHSPRPSPARSSGNGRVRRGLFLGVAFLAIAIPSASRSGLFGGTTPTNTIDIVETSAVAAHFADFGLETPSADTRHVADWVADSRDNGGVGFIIVDKKTARIHIFNGGAQLLASTPVLLGAARGDDAVPGIGTRPIAEVRPEERTTHAGRFVAERGHNTLGEDVVWVDYEAAVSMHRVRATEPRERRLERLATPAALDNRISYGCINVPVAFYETYIRPLFAQQHAIVYVLPEVKPVRQVFGSYDVAALRGNAPVKGN